MTCTIRPATPQDQAALAEQFLGLNLHEDGISHDRPTDLPGAEECLAVAWAAVRKSDGHALVAEIDGRVIGHLFMLYDDGPVFVRPELRRHAHISDLFVRAEARGRGVAGALMAEAERLAVSAGMRRLSLGVLAGNHAAEALYDRLGFTARAHLMGKAIGPQ